MGYLEGDLEFFSFMVNFCIFKVSSFAYSLFIYFNTNVGRALKRRCKINPHLVLEGLWLLVVMLTLPSLSLCVFVSTASFCLLFQQRADILALVALSECERINPYRPPITPQDRTLSARYVCFVISLHQAMLFFIQSCNLLCGTGNESTV